MAHCPWPVKLIRPGASPVANPFFDLGLAKPSLKLGVVVELKATGALVTATVFARGSEEMLAPARAPRLTLLEHALEVELLAEASGDLGKT